MDKRITELSRTESIDALDLFVVATDPTGSPLTQSIRLSDLEANLDHDNLMNYAANQHIDWTNASENLVTTGYGRFSSLGIGIDQSYKLDVKDESEDTYAARISKMTEDAESITGGFNVNVLANATKNTSTGHYGLVFALSSGDNSYNYGNLYGIQGYSYMLGSGVVASAHGIKTGVRIYAGSSGTITIARGGLFQSGLNADSTGNITNLYGIQITDALKLGSGSITNNYALHISDQTGGVNNRAINLVGSGLSNGIYFADDTNLYRSAANLLRTDDSFQAGGYKSSDGSAGITGTALPTSTLTVKNGLITAIA